MIIKGVFRRYERWNPVHPTSGAFWGLGVGIGCGVGWGPGFGPEVIGYVGAGCGLGFSVGFTLLGAGIGLPANWLFHLPYNAVMAARSSALEIGQSSGFPFSKSIAGEGWNSIAPCITNLQREASGRFSSFKDQHLLVLEKGVDISDLKSRLSVSTRSLSQGFEAFGGRLFRFPKELRKSHKRAKMIVSWTFSTILLIQKIDSVEALIVWWIYYKDFGQGVVCSSASSVACDSYHYVAGILLEKYTVTLY